MNKETKNYNLSIETISIQSGKKNSLYKAFQEAKKGINNVCWGKFLKAIQSNNLIKMFSYSKCIKISEVIIKKQNAEIEKWNNEHEDNLMEYLTIDDVQCLKCIFSAPYDENTMNEWISQNYKFIKKEFLNENYYFVRHAIHIYENTMVIFAIFIKRDVNDKKDLTLICENYQKEFSSFNNMKK